MRLAGERIVPENARRQQSGRTQFSQRECEEGKEHSAENGGKQTLFSSGARATGIHSHALISRTLRSFSSGAREPETRIAPPLIVVLNDINKKRDGRASSHASSAAPLRR